MLEAQPLMARVTNKPNLGKKYNPNIISSDAVHQKKYTLFFKTLCQTCRCRPVTAAILKG